MLNPFNDYIVVDRVNIEKTTASWIYLWNNIQSDSYWWLWIVISLWKDCKQDLNIWDKIWFSRNFADTIKNFDWTEYLVVQEKNVYWKEIE